MGFTMDWDQQFVNLGVGAGEVAALRVDAIYINAAFRDTERGIGKPCAHGDKAVDAGSGVGICVISIRSDSGRIGIVQAGDKLRIMDASGAEHVGFATIDDVISFNATGIGADARLYAGVAPADYSLPAYIDGLRIFTDPLGQAGYVHFDDLNLDEASYGGIHLGRFNLSTGTNAETELVGTQTAYAAAHDPVTGAHLANAIPDAAINTVAFAGQGWENIIWGRFQEDSNGDGLGDNWFLYNTPTAYVLQASVTPPPFGVLEQSITTDQPQDGIYTLPFPPYYYNNFLGEIVTFGIWVYATVNDTIQLEIWDGVGSTVSAPGGVAGSWAFLYVTHTVAAGATTLEFRVYSTVGTIFSVVGGIAKRGRLPVLYAHNPTEHTFARAIFRDYENHFINSNFADWTNGTTALPDWWYPGAMAPAAIARSATRLFGDFSFDVTLALNQSCYYDAPNYLDFAGRNIYYCFHHRGVAALTPLTAIVTDGVNPPAPINFTPLAGTWNSFIIPYTVAAAPTRLRIEIIHNAVVAATQILLDGFILTTDMPTHYKPAKWQLFDRTWFKAAASTANMNHQGSVQDIFPVGSPLLIHKIFVYAGTAPGGAVVDTFTVQLNGAPTGVLITLTGAQQAASFHLPGGVAFAQGARLSVGMTAGGGSASANIGCAVEGIRLGY